MDSLANGLARLKGLGGLKLNTAKNHVASTPHWVLARRGRARLLHYKSAGDAQVFIVPSLINRYYILDLFPGCSLIEALTQAGINVYLLDWGNSREQDQFSTIEDHVLNWLKWGHQLSCKHAKTSAMPIFGQCIGGTLASMYASLYPAQVSGLCFLTTPFDFKDAGVLSHWARHSSIDLTQMSEVWGNISGGFLARSFKLIEPLADIRKYQMLFKYSSGANFLKKYIAMECWLADAIHFPGQSYAKFIQELYQENQLINNRFKLAGKKVRLANIKTPILNLYCLGDIIVPPESSNILEQLVSSTEVKTVALKGGHIGCLISDKYQKDLWRELSTWVLEKQHTIQNEVIYA